MTQTILITGAGTGFGRETALRAAEKGARVIAGVEIVAQIASLQEEARQRGVTLQVEKLDVTDHDDRTRAWSWEIDVLLNNAGISEGGSTADIPAENLRRQFEVNVIGPVLLTQGFVRKMVHKGEGKIVFMSSVAGLTVDPFTGAYAGSKHAIEAFAEALRAEMLEFGVQVATVNPGPFLTGFNDRMFETWKTWRDDPAARVFDYSKLDFPHEQFDPEPVISTTLQVLLENDGPYRNVVPLDYPKQVKAQQQEAWTRQRRDDLGQRHSLVEKAYEIEPGTPANT
jgi:short-subunit dehydrogenase